jgi:hypothetical protein
MALSDSGSSLADLPAASFATLRFVGCSFPESESESTTTTSCCRLAARLAAAIDLEAEVAWVTLGLLALEACSTALLSAWFPLTLPAEADSGFSPTFVLVSQELTTIGEVTAPPLPTVASTFDRYDWTLITRPFSAPVPFSGVSVFGSLVGFRASSFSMRLEGGLTGGFIATICS